MKVSTDVRGADLRALPEVRGACRVQAQVHKLSQACDGSEVCSSLGVAFNDAGICAEFGVSRESGPTRHDFTTSRLHDFTTSRLHGFGTMQLAMQLAMLCFEP